MRRELYGERVLRGIFLVCNAWLPRIGAASRMGLNRPPQKGE